MSQLLDHFGIKRHPFARSAAKDGLLRHRGFEEALGRLRFTVELDGPAISPCRNGEKLLSLNR